MQAPAFQGLAILAMACLAAILLVFWPEAVMPLALGHGDHGSRSATSAFGLSDAQTAKAPIKTKSATANRIESPSGVFHTLSLASIANARLEQPDEWKERIWKGQIRQLPRGQQSFAGIPFYVIPKSENQGLAAVTLIGGRYKEGPSGGGVISVVSKAAAVYVLHTASYQNLNRAREMANYVFSFSDGTKWTVPARNQIELADFMQNQNLNDDCVVAWNSKHPLFDNYYAVYALRLVNPYPDKEITSIEFIPAMGSAVVSVLGVTLGESVSALTPLQGVEAISRPNEASDSSATLELTVEADGIPTPARLVVQGSDGKVYQPFDGLNYQMLWRPHPFFYTTGSLSMKVPAGNVDISIAKGFEFKPLRITIPVQGGPIVKHRVSLERWIDLPALGWYSGEMHIHPFDQEPEDTAICQLAEDLHVANLLVWGSGFAKRYHGDQFFSGKPEGWPDSSHVAYYNEEFRNNTYGHLCLIDLRELVYPMGTGSEYQTEDYPANAVTMDRTHSQSGFVSIAHMSIPPVNYATPWEVGVDVALGKADSVDIDLTSFDRAKDRSLDLWYRLLNCGYHIPATCGTDSFMNQSWTNTPLGNVRTYCYLGKDFSYRRWVDAARQGRSFVTKGPALFLSIDGKMPGDTVTLRNGENLLEACVEAQPLYPLKRVELIVNGQVVSSVDGNGATETLRLNHVIKMDGSRSYWVAARAESQSSDFFLHGALLAHTNPIYCAGANPLHSQKDAEFFVNEINGLINWVETKGVFSSSTHRAEVKKIFEDARLLYEQQAQNRVEVWKIE